jgi:hypothetical protein
MVTHTVRLGNDSAVEQQRESMKDARFEKVCRVRGICIHVGGSFHGRSSVSFIPCFEHFAQRKNIEYEDIQKKSRWSGPNVQVKTKLWYEGSRYICEYTKIQPLC